MKWIEVKVVFEAENTELAEDLISNIFYDFSLQGVVCEVPDMEPEEGWGDDAVAQPESHSVSGYFPQNDLAEIKCGKIRASLEELKAFTKFSYEIVTRELDEEDWAESWKAYFWPEKISDKMVVKPTWRDYSPGEGEIIIEIDPGMAFGTGTHPTTSLCLNMIEKYLRPGSSLLDVGTGSGILMIGAAKLGAGRLWGVDNDEVAVGVAEKNLLINNVDKKDFVLKAGNLVNVVKDRFDVVVANILAEVVVILLDSVKNVLAENGSVIFSGIIEEKKDMVTEKMTEKGLEVTEVAVRDGWVAIVGKKK